MHLNSAIRVGARSSPLSRAQVEEVFALLPSLVYTPIWVQTTGDRDRVTSLREIGKTDFFTRELDQMLLKGEIDIAIHSAKDLPEPLPEGLSLIALTQGVDPRDSLVFREGETLLPHSRIATSSLRREERIRELCPDLTFVDIRGTIEERLAKLDRGEVDGVVIAEAALIRLKLTHLSRLILSGETAPLQGRLAILARTGDEAMQNLFRPLHHRLPLYLGLDPARFGRPCFHCPIIETKRIDTPNFQNSLSTALSQWPHFSHMIFTSRSTVRHWWEVWRGTFHPKALAIGDATAAALRERGVEPLVAPVATQEGMIALLQELSLRNVLFPHSALARPHLIQALQALKVPFLAFPLYETHPRTPEWMPSFDWVEEIVFTSPSTVSSFLRLFGSLPVAVRLRAIGPVTQRALDIRALK